MSFQFFQLHMCGVRIYKIAEVFKTYMHSSDEWFNFTLYCTKSPQEGEKKQIAQ